MRANGGRRACGKIMEQARARIGKSTEEIARETGESEETVKKWLKGEKAYDFGTFMKICRSLELSPDDLINPLGW